jgi:hypothetical protein
VYQLLLNPLVLLVPSAISAVACIWYTVKVRSTASITLAVGVSGGFVMSVVRSSFSTFAQAVSGGNPMTLTWATMTTTALSYAFALVFAVALFFVLMEAARWAAAASAGTGSPPA